MVGRFKGASEVTPLAEVTELYLEDVERLHSAQTTDAYRGPLRLLIRFLTETLGRDPRLADLTLENVLSWMDALQRTPKRMRGGLAEGNGVVARETLRTYLRTIRVFSRWLTRAPYRLLAVDPLTDLKLPRASRRFKQPLNADEIEALFDAVDAGTIVGARDRAMLLMLLDGGLRATELANLRYGDLNIRDQAIFVASGKGDASRYVTLGQTTLADLRVYLLVHEALLCGAAVTVDGSYLRAKPAEADLDDTPLFPTVRGEYFEYEGLKSWFRRIAERAGVPRAHLHLMRHTSAAQTLDAGADIRVVQLRLGHKDITTTQRYLHLAREQLARLQSQFSPVDHLGIGKPDSERGSRRNRSTRPSQPMWRRHAERTTPGKRAAQPPKKEEKPENDSQRGDDEEPGAPVGVRK